MPHLASQVASALTEKQTTALIAFLDRATFSDFQKKARTMDEAHEMVDAADRLRKTLTGMSSSLVNT